MRLVNGSKVGGAALIVLLALCASAGTADAWGAEPRASDSTAESSAKPLHWQGTIEYEDHDAWSVEYSDHSGFLSRDQTASAAWQVDAHTEEGFDTREWQPDPAEHRLDYTDSSWRQRIVTTQEFGCFLGPNVPYDAEAEGGGGGPSDGESPGTALWIEFGPGSLLTENGVSFSLNSPPGQWRENYATETCGLQPESGSRSFSYGIFPLGDAFSSPASQSDPQCGGLDRNNPLALDGTKLVLDLTGSEPCTTVGAEEETPATWALRANLTVTCPGGAAPDASWHCPIQTNPLVDNPAVSPPEGGDATQPPLRQTGMEAPRPSLIRRVCGSGAVNFGTLFGSLGGGLLSIQLAAIDEAAAAASGLGGAAVGALSLGCALTGPAQPESSTFAEGACGALSGASITLGAGALFTSPTLIGGVLLGGASLLTGFFGSLACSGDPPATAYARVATPSFHLIGPRSRPGLTTAQSTLLAEVRNSMAKLRGYGRALALCVDRASGAEAAHDLRWERRQRSCAAADARRVAALYRAQIPLRHRIHQALAASGFRNGEVDVPQMISALRHPTKRVRRLLGRSGLTGPQISFVEQEAGHLRLAGKLPRTMLDAVDGPEIVTALRKGAKGFEVLAARQRQLGG